MSLLKKLVQFDHRTVRKFVILLYVIKNVANEDMTPNEIITKIASSLDVEMRETDISNVYRPKKRNDKIVVEFTFLGKKRELMSKISRHRLAANIVNNTEKQNSSNNSRYIYKIYLDQRWPNICPQK